MPFLQEGIEPAGRNPAFVLQTEAMQSLHGGLVSSVAGRPANTAKLETEQIDG